MNRQSSKPRSFLRQLAEPLPRAAALLTSRRSPGGRGASANPDLAAIPPIFDGMQSTGNVINPTDNKKSSHRHAEAPSSHIVLPQAPPSRETPDHNLESRTVKSRKSDNTSPTVRKAGIEPPIRIAAEPFVASTLPKTAAPQNEATPPRTQDHQTKSPASRSQQPTTILTAVPTPRAQSTAAPAVTKDKSGSGIRVHIGTVEVRVPAPPKPAPSARDANTRSIHNTASPSRSAQPLSRGLAWSHGLVQG